MSRNRHRGPVVGGVVNAGRGDATRQARNATGRRAARELREIARAAVRGRLKIPTTKEVLEVARTKE